VKAQPSEYRLSPGNTALVVVDMQLEFLAPGGYGAAFGNDVTRLHPAIAPIQALLDAWRTRGWPVMHTRELHKPDLSDCPPGKRARGVRRKKIGDDGPMGRYLVAGEPGTEIIPELAPNPGELVVDKPGKGMFWGTTKLHEILQHNCITHLVFTGASTEAGVQTSMREANDRGYECLLVEDATGSCFPELKAATLAMIAAQGGNVGWHATSQALLRALRQGA
jgi:nicotinamidase-related amidase